MTPKPKISNMKKLSLPKVVEMAALELGDDYVRELLDHAIKINKIIPRGKLKMLILSVCEVYEITEYKLMNTRERKFPRQYAMATLVYHLNVNEKLSFGEIKKVLKMSKSNAHRLVKTIENLDTSKKMDSMIMKKTKHSYEIFNQKLNHNGRA